MRTCRHDRIDDHDGDYFLVYDDGDDVLYYHHQHFHDHDFASPAGDDPDDCPPDVRADQYQAGRADSGLRRRPEAAPVLEMRDFLYPSSLIDVH